MLAPIGDIRGSGERMVNLTVTCEKDAAHLNFSSGGLKVSSVRLAQHCRVLGESKSSDHDCEVSTHLLNNTPHSTGGTLT